MEIKLHLYIFSSVVLFVSSIVAVPYIVSISDVSIASAKTDSLMCIDQTV